ncbi:MAG: minichromosome maintenance protein MCM [Candidatus Thermoplasmatota archaeon]|nr:minichromosome maintenance protein MCM [Candidatus Thermoplasmatota archaeon]
MAAHDASARWRTFLEEAKESEVMMLLSKQSPYPFLEVPFHELQSFDPDFAEDLLREPSSILERGSHALKQICRERGEDLETVLRVSELPRDSHIALRDIGRVQVNTLCGVEVIVTKISDIKPRIHRATFRCEACGELIEVIQKNERELKEPLSCPQASGGCGSSRRETRFELVLDISRLVNNQWMEIQELPENIPSGGQPGRGMVLIEGDQVNKHLPGQRITANVIPVIHSEVKRGKKTPLFDIIYHMVSSEHESIPFNEISISDEDKEMIVSVSQRDDLFTLMRDSIAPAVFPTGRMPYVKRSLALQLFGGVARVNPDRTRMRGDIHILLMGDPGVAKSQLLQYMSKISPRGKLASGGGVSGAGLTAAAVKDAFSDGRFALEAGILPLSDRGLAAIDEFDKITEEDRRTMHPAMEQQEIYIAKGGITATLPARCSILAAANPTKGRFTRHANRTRSVMYNFKETGLPVPLASRFDIIWLLRDEVRVEDDERIARHILDTRTLAVSETKIEEGMQLDPSSEQEDLVFATGVDNKEYLTINFLRKYIAYAKRHVHPDIDEKARKKIQDFYRDARLSFDKDDLDSMNNNEEAVITITARALESLIRLTEAHARLHLRDIATEEDADLAIAIYKHWREETRIEDESELHSGVSASSRRVSSSVRGMLRQVCSEKGHAERIDIYNLALPMNIPEHVVDEVISKMLTSGELWSPQLDRFSFVR